MESRRLASGGLPFAPAARNNGAGGRRSGALADGDLHATDGEDSPAEGCDLSGLIARAEQAATLLKAMGHDGRLTILCHLRTGPKSVTELENLLSARQAIVSQQLARLRLEGLVSARREGQAIYYSLLDPKVTAMIEVLARLYRTEHG